jgi:hypothetical protein
MSNTEEEDIIVKKVRKCKPNKNINKKVELDLIEEPIFINQVNRKDVLANMLSNVNLTGKELFYLIKLNTKLISLKLL